MLSASVFVLRLFTVSQLHMHPQLPVEEDYKVCVCLERPKNNRNSKATNKHRMNTDETVD